MYDVAFHVSILLTVLSHAASVRISSSATDTNPITAKTTNTTSSTTTRPLSPSTSSSSFSEKESLSNPNAHASPPTKANGANPLPLPSTSTSTSSSCIPHHYPSPASFRRFQNNYLLVYLLAVAADWVQGPYVYALYSHYGFSKQDIGRLYIAGFASSAVFGTFVASIADKYGRRRNALCYCFVYALSCVTKHSSNFHVLLLGRILGGIAYSILFSAFESWMVYEHHARSFEPSSIATTFARAQLGNGVVAVVSGLVAGWCADVFGSKVAPFDLSIFILLTLSVVLYATWGENHGDMHTSVRGGLGRAVRTLVSDRKIVLLGIAQAAFEGALYTFTFVWTPALTGSADGNEIPHGVVFATFMACTMIGSNLFAVLSAQGVRVERLMTIVFALGAVCFLGITAWVNHIQLIFLAFLQFELLCGVYFPGMATARAPYIPEECRSAILTFFRIPLNVVVVVALYRDMQVRSVFALCGALMTIGAVSMHMLTKMAEDKGGGAVENEMEGVNANGIHK